jgi:vacuolar protein sorting-associated protein 35
MASSPTATQDQGRLLEEALGVVRMQSSQMRKCLETPGKLMDALKCGFEASDTPPILQRY